MKKRKIIPYIIMYACCVIAGIMIGSKNSNSMILSFGVLVFFIGITSTDWFFSKTISSRQWKLNYIFAVLAMLTVTLLFRVL